MVSYEKLTIRFYIKNQLLFFSKIIIHYQKLWIMKCRNLLYNIG